MVDTIRSFIRNYSFLNELARVNRFRKIVNLNEARSIGILYNLVDENSYRIIEGIVGKLQQTGKEVKAVGLVRNKSMVNRFLPKLSYDFLTRKDINWFGKPTGIRVRDFIQRDWDILIDLSLDNNQSLKYIAGLSNARLKVGPSGKDKEHYYDFMINAAMHTTVIDFYEQVEHYLLVINAGTNPL